MTPQEAYSLVNAKVNNKNIVACFEYKDYYLFTTVPKNYKMDLSKGLNIPLDSAVIINKDSRDISIYNPIEIDLGDKYEIIENFK